VKSDTSAGLFDKARAVIPGGVDSPVRAPRGVGAHRPLFIALGRAAHTGDVDDNEYLDLSSWGPMIVGWCHPQVREALPAVVDEGTSFAAPAERDVRLAELLCEALPSVEMRMVDSGTEATWSALRPPRVAAAAPLANGARGGAA
jgi:glutamate-1-semialdehyde 2,1-aminomutase